MKNEVSPPEPSERKWKTVPEEGAPTNIYEVLWRCRGHVERVVAWSEPDRSRPGSVLTERKRCTLDRDHEGNHTDD